MLHVLRSGLRVILQESHTAPVVALQVWVAAGSTDDPEELSGLAHVMEHMIFKGTARRPGGQISREIERAGGQINAWTSFDQTVFHVVIASRFLRRGLEVLADVLQNARFDEDKLARELQVIQEEIKQGEDSPGKAASRALFANAYRKHPYHRPVIGRAESVRRIKRSDVERFYRAFYAPSNMTLVVVGDISAPRALTRIRRLFDGRRPRAPHPRPRPDEPPQRRARVKVLSRETQEAYLSMAFHIPKLSHPDTPALDLAATVLGAGESARLVRKVKNEQQLVNLVYAYTFTPRDPGLLMVGATTSPDRLEPAVEAITRQVLELGRVEIPADELSRAKTLIESEAVYQRETVQGQARKLGFYQTVSGSVGFELEYRRRVAGTTAAEVRSAVARYLRPGRLSLVALTPRAAGKEREISSALTRLVRQAGQQVQHPEPPQITRSGKVVRVKLSSGATLLVRRDSSVPLVSMRAVWNGGLRYEREETNGFNNLLAMLITRGTTTRTADQINSTIEKLAGAIGGFTGNNSFGLHLELLASHWEQGLEILVDCILNPAFSPQEVEHARRQALEEIQALKDNVGAVAVQLFTRTLYRRHPYRMNTLGTLQSISSLSREALLRYYRRHFHAGKMVLSVVGDVDPPAVEANFRRLLGHLRLPGRLAVKVPDEPLRRAAESVIHLVNKQQAHIVVGFPGTTVRSKDRFALEVLASVLSGQSGRLFAELRERRALAYQVSAFSLEGVDPGYFAIYLATSPERAQDALSAIDEQLGLIRDRLISPSELSRVQRYLVGTYEISLQRRSSIAAHLAFSECYGLGHMSYTRYAPSILAVTPEEVRRVARRYLDNSKRVLVVVKPEELSPAAARRLGDKRQAGVVDPAAPGPAKRSDRSKKR